MVRHALKILQDLLNYLLDTQNDKTHFKNLAGLIQSLFEGRTKKPASH